MDISDVVALKEVMEKFRILIVAYVGSAFTKQGDLDVQIGGDVSFERVEIFGYLGDMLSSKGGCEHAMLTKVSKAWNKFREVEVIFVCQENGSDCNR